MSNVRQTGIRSIPSGERPINRLSGILPSDFSSMRQLYKEGVSHLVKQTKRANSDQSGCRCLVGATQAQFKKFPKLGTLAQYCWNTFGRQFEELQVRENCLSGDKEKRREHGARMSARSEKETASWKAAHVGDKEKIKNILNSKKVDINMKFDEGKTMLHVAASNRHGHLVASLCRRGADINDKDNNGSTPLHSAIIGGNLNIVKKLIKLGADVNANSDENFTPLHSAAELKHVSIVECLLNSGADVNCTNNLRDTALSLAVKQASYCVSCNPHSQKRFADFVKITEMLLKKGASVNSHGWQGFTPLHYASHINQYWPQIVRLLLDYGADINSVDTGDATPIFYAENEMILEILIERGANVNYVSEVLFTPLSKMIRYRPSCAEFLLRNGTDVNIENNEGENILEFNWPDFNLDNAGILEGIINQMADVDRATFCLQRDDKYPEFIELLISIIVKRKVSEEISIDVEYLDPDHLIIDYENFFSVISMCKWEICKMKETKINLGELTVHDILNMPINKLLNYVKRNELLALEFDEVEKDFPIYARMFKSHIKEARKRRCLLDSSAEAFEKLIFVLHEIKLPNLVVKKIVLMLSNGYLTTLAQV
ncbi:putative ankyrin repeat protein RF_0381 [Belonocnema kinseyi]|uniref:putative ankyrin repeat protein RF_0381 n=1 Tax=Belonocnema kinseyi TaxID=2817044 RepID=UPI00143D291E|nr:putative ankyrin repeat protein RF_0381 [Belonocnema kinseyi]